MEVPTKGDVVTPVVVELTPVLGCLHVPADVAVVPQVDLSVNLHACRAEIGPQLSVGQEDSCCPSPTHFHGPLLTLESEISVLVEPCRVAVEAVGNGCEVGQLVKQRLVRIAHGAVPGPGSPSRGDAEREGVHVIGHDHSHRPGENSPSKSLVIDRQP